MDLLQKHVQAPVACFFVERGSSNEGSSDPESYSLDHFLRFLSVSGFPEMHVPSGLCDASLEGCLYLGVREAAGKN